MLGQLQDAGNVVTIKSYLELLEGASLTKLLYKYSTRPLSQRSSSPKLLPLCPALIHSATSPSKIARDAQWYGRVFECCIGAHLLYIRNAELFYWRDGQHEVDFIVSKDDTVLAIEIKSSSKAARASGLEHFKRLFPEAKLLVLNKESGELFLQQPHTGDLWGFLLAMV